MGYTKGTTSTLGVATVKQKCDFQELEAGPTVFGCSAVVF